MAEVLERSATFAPVQRDTPPPPKAPKLLDQVRERICVLHYARATEIVAGEMKMLGSKPEGAPATAPAPTASEPRPATAPAAGNFNDFEDDIPF